MSMEDAMTLEAAARRGKIENNVVPLTETKPVMPNKDGEEKVDEVIVHVRFHPNGLVNTIDCRPEHLSREVWFYHLRCGAPLNYQVFAGGRGMFRIQRSRFEDILAESKK
jgi:hypothetical protein